MNDKPTSQAQRMALVTLKHAKKYIKRMHTGDCKGGADAGLILMLKLATSMVEGAEELIIGIGIPNFDFSALQKLRKGSQ